MGDEIQRLVTVWDARFDKFEAKLNKMTRATYGAANKVEKRLDATSKKVDSAFGTIKIGALEQLVSGSNRYVVGLNKLGLAGVGAAVGIGAVVAALAQARAAAAFSDEIADTAKQARVTTDTLQEYRYMLRQLGGDAGQADEALKGFSTRLGEAQAQRGRAGRGFKELGFDQATLNSWKTAEERAAGLEEVLRRIGQLSGSQQDAALKALGLEALQPAVQSGVQEMQRLRAEAHAIGVVMDAELIQKGADAHDKFETLTQIIDVQLKSALVDLTPVLLDLLGLAVDIAKAFQDATHWLRQATPSEQYEAKVKELGRVQGQIDRIQSGAARASGPFAGMWGAAGDKREIAILEQRKRTLIAEANAALAATKPPPAAPPPERPATRTLIPQTKPKGGDKGDRDRSEEAIASALQQQLAAEQHVLQIVIGQMGAHEDRASAILELARLEELEIAAKQAERDKRTKEAKNLSAAAKAQILASSAIVAEQEQMALDLQTARQLADAAQEQEQAALQTRKEIQDSLDEMARVQADEALTAKERRRIELEVFERSRILDRAILQSKLDYLVAIQAITPDERTGRLGAFDTESEAGRQGIKNANRDPLEQGRKDAAREGLAVGEDIIKTDDIVARYQAMYDAIDEMREQNLLNEEQAGRAMAQLHARYNEERLSNASTFFGTLAQLANSENKKLAAIGKAAAIAQATIDGFLAVQKALASAPPPWNFAIAAAVGVVAAANVASIAGVPGFEKGGTPPVGRAYLVGERGPEIRVDHRPGTILPNNILDRLGDLNVPTAQASAGPTHLHMSIDLAGANGDATIRQIARAAAEEGGRAAYRQAMRDTPGRIAKYRKLGT